jgi:hypothetical protein
LPDGGCAVGATLRREDDYWTLCLCRDYRPPEGHEGSALVHLLEHPGQEPRVLDLLGQTTNAAFEEPEVRSTSRAAGLSLLDATARTSSA